MDFKILGPLEVFDDDRPVALGGAKQRALLALLLLHANEVVSQDRLLDELWGDGRSERGTKVLQVAVSRLRRALEPQLSAGQESRLLITRAPGYELRVEPGTLDLHRFQSAVASGRDALAAGNPAVGSALLSDALALWRGPPLADLGDESFAHDEIGRLEEVRAGALEDRIAADLELGHHAQLVAELRTIARRQPLRERVRAQLMLALYRSGRQAEALEVYADARRVLVEELGIEPGRELQELQAAILGHDESLRWADRAATEPVDSPPPAAEAPRTRPAGPSQSAFVGRAAELAELTAGLDDAFSGRGRLFVLIGEPGIGKSRLAEELIADARTRGARVLIGRCWEAGGAPAYWPWVQALRVYVRETETSELRAQLGAGGPALAQILPELRERLPELTEPLALESDGARFRLFAATAEFLRNASEVRPIVLVLDDLHAADDSSLLLLRFLARELSTARILAVGACRDVDPIPGHALTAMLTELAREPQVRRLSLAGLSEAEIAQYVELTTSRAAATNLVAALYEQTEGNPLFVGEVVRLRSVEDDGSGSTGRQGVATAIQEVIGRRLGHLSEQCHRVLVLASVIGREFRMDILGRLAGVSDVALLETLDEAVTARVVSDVPGSNDRLRFAHALIRETLYESVTMPRRVRLHRLAVQTLEDVYGEAAGAHFAELAHHAIAGGLFEKAVQHARRAGDRALDLLAYEEAARLYATALDALESTAKPDEGARCELLLSIGEAEARAGNSSSARRAFLDAASVARRAALPRRLALAAAGYGGRLVWGRAGDDERLVPLLEEGLAALADADIDLRVRLLARLAGALRDERARDRRDALSDEAVALARQAQAPAVLAYALDGRMAAILAPDTVAECLALAGELRDIAGKHGDLEALSAALCYSIEARLTIGDISGAKADLAAASRNAEELRQPAQLFVVRGVEAMIAVAEGRFEEAGELSRQTLAYGEPVHPDAARSIDSLHRYAICEACGGLQDVEAAVRAAVGRHPSRTIFRCALVCLLARTGRPSEARRELGELAAGEFAALPFDKEWLAATSFLAETCVRLGELEAADGLYELMRPWAAYNVVDQAEVVRGSVSGHLGMLAALLKRWQAAERHFEDAIAMNKRMGARPWVAHTQAAYARMLLDRCDPGDRQHAQRLVASALATYGALGMTSHAEITHALCAQQR